MSKIVFPSLKGKITEVIDTVIGLSELESLSEETFFQLRLSVDEIVANIVDYAYPETGDGKLEVWVERSEEQIRLTFADEGLPFNPLCHEDPDITLSAEEREIGGLGIFLVKKVMDNVEYEYRDGQNRLTISKNLTK